jgi:MinD superfamily P-loop ATPase
MKQVAVISGKGGTGKSSVVASFSALAAPLITADCDVDAANLHLVFDPQVEATMPFKGGFSATIDAEACTHCDRCRELCRFEAISEAHVIDPMACEGCGVCVDNCPESCIGMDQPTAGEWYRSESRFGPLVHARLGIAEENSGKLVAQVREEAQRLSKERDLELILIDGSPGVGCSVISSITGTDLVLVVTEPSVSGLHDMDRVLELARHFKVPAAVLVNKADLNTEISARIQARAEEIGASFIGELPYDTGVTHAMVAGKAVTEMAPSETGAALERAYMRLRALVWPDVDETERENMNDRTNKGDVA